MKNGVKIGIGMMIAFMFICVIVPMNVAADDCGSCGGTGKCKTCGGDGFFGEEAGTPITCPDCEGSEECQTCGGSGELTPGFELLGVGIALGLCIGIIGWRRRKK